MTDRSRVRWRSQSHAQPPVLLQMWLIWDAVFVQVECLSHLSSSRHYVRSWCC